MNVRQFLHSSTREERERVAKAAGTTIGVFYQLAGGHKRPSWRMMRRLIEADPRFTVQDLCPELFGGTLDVGKRPAPRRTKVQKALDRAARFAAHAAAAQAKAEAAAREAADLLARERAVMELAAADDAALAPRGAVNGSHPAPSATVAS